tara:strand:+ start:6957 stop:7475 length:519 start_codon:yes stop_codon:yes gene_type:complete
MALKFTYSLLNRILVNAPILLLFISVFNEFDFNYLNYKYFSFNFPFILIFYWSLKRIESLGYGYIFIAGLFNDTVLGFPIGLSSLTYLIICGFAAYLRNITLRPSLFRDWLYFLFTILVANSINYFLLVTFFSIELNYYELTGNILFTFLLYYIFGYLFDIYQRLALKKKND